MIYLDHNATTPVAPEAADAAARYLGAEFGNPSNEYDLGRRAKAALEEARSQTARLIGTAPGEVIFTSGGTESNNAALKGVFHRVDESVHIVTTRIEHPAVINPALFLMMLGAEVTFVRSDAQGLVDPAEIEKAIRPETALVSLMLANNETGVIQPVADVGRITRTRGVLFHTDAAQAIGKIPVDVDGLGVDLLTVAGHKLYAPKGVGALYVRSGVDLEPIMHGAGQEAGRRAGTENVALAAALGEACRLAREHLAEDGPRLAALRDRLWERLSEGLPEAILIGHPEKRLPNTLNVCLPGRIGSEILDRCPEIRASTGAACHAGQVKVSPVLAAMGIDQEIAKGAIRLTLGRSNTRDQVEEAAAALIRAAAA